MVSRIPKAAVTAFRIGAMSAVAIILATVSSGWLYWLERPTSSWPGPRVTDALPLDELAGHANISLIVFAVVMTAAGILTAMFARLLKFDGFAIALSVGVGIGAWQYIASAVSIFVVRQVSVDASFDAARDLPPIYITAALFALAVGLFARRSSGEQWLTRLVPASVGILGVINLLIATLPRSLGVNAALGGLLSAPTSPISRTIDVTIGMVLLLCARGLGQRSRRALWFAIVLVFISLISRIVDGFTVIGLVVDLYVLLSLLARRSDFSFGGDPNTRMSGVRRFFALALCALGYGMIALLINRTAAELPYHFLTALRVTLLALVIGAPSQASQISGGFSEWFPWSLRAIVGLGIVWGASSWFAPWRYRPTDQAESRLQAKHLVAAWGRDTLAPFTLRQDKALYFYPDDAKEATTLIAYRVVRGVAIVSGDPVGPVDQAHMALASFQMMCASRGWRFALLGAGEQFLETYKDLGLRALYHGDEAIVDVRTFSLVGGKMKSARQAVHRVTRKGYQVEICTTSELKGSVRNELSTLEQQWLAGGKRKGFVMELDELFRLDGDDAIFAIGRDAAGSLVGFLEIAVCPASDSLSLSSMPRASDAPNGLNAFLIVAVLEWARDHAYEALSLNFSPAARLLDRDAHCSGWRRLARLGLLIVKRLLGLQLDNLLIFNRHFAPRWQPRYVIVSRLRDLPRIIVAAMAAERYLPFSELVRGHDRPIAVRHEGERPTITSNK